jgi:hypothetical protein
MGQGIGLFFGGMIGLALSFALYRLYFTRSVRVRIYMGTDTYITQCQFTKNVSPPQPAVPDAQ